MTCTQPQLPAEDWLFQARGVCVTAVSSCPPQTDLPALESPSFPCDELARMSDTVLAKQHRDTAPAKRYYSEPLTYSSQLCPHNLCGCY